MILPVEQKIVELELLSMEDSPKLNLKKLYNFDVQLEGQTIAVWREGCQFIF